MKAEILKYICYFDIFNHPLKKEELVYLCASNKGVISAELDVLIAEKSCFEKDNYYSIQQNIEELIEDRKVKEKGAIHYFKKLPSYARLISLFPFVRGIAISGSLSKNVMHEDGDIDFFIITAPGRVWISRTLLVLFKKVFLFNSKKYFCVNYFVDEDNLMIQDKNIFTAVESTHLLPVYNKKLIDKLKQTNNWTNEYVNNFEHPIQIKDIKGRSWIGRFIEFVFKGKMGDRFDLYLMKFTYRKWEKKFKHFDATKFELTMRSNRGVSKHHPRDFQNKVLKEYDIRIKKFNIVQ